MISAVTVRRSSTANHALQSLWREADARVTLGGPTATEAHAVVDANPFVPAREQFESLVERLDGAETRRMTHGEVERLLQTDGTELLRRLF